MQISLPLQAQVLGFIKTLKAAKVPPAQTYSFKPAATLTVSVQTGTGAGLLVAQNSGGSTHYLFNAYTGKVSAVGPTPGAMRPATGLATVGGGYDADGTPDPEGDYDADGNWTGPDDGSTVGGAALQATATTTAASQPGATQTGGFSLSNLLSNPGSFLSSGLQSFTQVQQALSPQKPATSAGAAKPAAAAAGSNTLLYAGAAILLGLLLLKKK